MNFKLPALYCTLFLISLFLSIDSSKAQSNGGVSFTINNLDSMYVDLFQQTCSPGKSQFPIYINSDDTIVSIDLQLKFDLTKFSYDALVNVDPNIFSIANYNPLDSILRVSCFTLQVFSNFSALTEIRFNVLSGIQMTSSDIEIVKAKLNGEDCSDRIIDFIPDVITATSGPNGSITPDGTVTLNCGDSRTFQIDPDSCFEILDVLVNGISQGPITSYDFPPGSDGQTISATFGPVNPVINSTAGAGGSISPSGNIAKLCGESQTFNILPDTCFEIADVIVDGISQGPISQYTFSDLQKSNNSISVTFDPIVWTVTATSGPNGSISPGGSTTLSCGDTLLFTMTPDPCYEVAAIFVNGINVGAAETYTVQSDIDDDQSITVVFSPITYSPGDGREDINRDGIVDISDFLQFLASFNLSCTCCPEDINLDGIVNNDDFLLLLGQFGNTLRTAKITTPVNKITDH